jgi:hypothetical protein
MASLATGVPDAGIWDSWTLGDAATVAETDDPADSLGPR